MIICGINATHDAAVAVVDGRRLVMSAECEKLGAGLRHDDLSDLEQVEAILGSEGIRLRDVDSFVLSGWVNKPGELAVLDCQQRGQAVQIPTAPYTDQGPAKDPLYRYEFAPVAGGPFLHGYASYSHVSNHVAGAYCCSPFARRCESAYVLAWDGGMVPRLYSVGPRPLKVKYLGPLMSLTGHCFMEYCMELEPFAVDTSTMTLREKFRVRQEVPGKAMAYAALGVSNQSAFALLDSLIDEHQARPSEKSIGAILAQRVRDKCSEMSSADLIATFQDYVGHRLVRNLARILHGKTNGRYARLCVSGGCALNIKWNSLMRQSGIFSEVWAPPFPNDAGAALGMACCEMMRGNGAVSLEWDVYSGPELDRHCVPRVWEARVCSEAQLAQVLHLEGEPVVVLYGRAELGPRALGNRSILAPAVHPGMKDRLNEIKKRASYRPVAPLCLESRAAEIFDPGCPDPYMLFEHQVRPGWAKRIPAVVHLDGSARLQTMGSSSANTATGRILEEYSRLSGIPVLCNTSANLPGHGFFQHALAASEWGGTRYVWAEGTLYTKPAEPVGAHWTRAS
jgi:carbamoyltransferase